MKRAVNRFGVPAQEGTYFIVNLQNLGTWFGVLSFKRSHRLGDGLFAYSFTMRALVPFPPCPQLSAAFDITLIEPGVLVRDKALNLPRQLIGDPLRYNMLVPGRQAFQARDDNGLFGFVF